MIPEELATFVQQSGRTVLVKGAAGTGKTLLCVELAREAQLQGREVIWMASRHMDPSESLDLESVVPPENLREGHSPRGDLMVAPPKWEDVVQEIEGDLKEEGTLVVVDSLEGLLQTGKDLDRLAEAAKALAIRRKATFILVAEQGGTHPVDHLVDGVLLLEQEFIGQNRMRTCRLLKMRGTEIRRAAIPFTLSHGRFQTYSHPDVTTRGRTVRPNARHGPDGGIATTVHEWDLALGGGLRGGSLHVVRYRRHAHPSLEVLLLPLMFNALACGWRVLLAGASENMGRFQTLIQDTFPGLSPGSLSLVNPNKPSALPSEDTRPRSPHEAELIRRRDAEPESHVLTIVDSSFDGARSNRTQWWSQWHAETHLKGNIDLFLEAEHPADGVPADTFWDFDLQLGAPVLRGQNPSTPLILLRYNWNRGYPETIGQVIE
ncbi:MAG: RAD55 family ATPase [Thermoplasmatota archaeon]